METELDLTILMPCLNEEKTVASCVRQAKEFLDASGIRGEVLVVDNGSTDGSQTEAAKTGARVITVEQVGYGRALLAGIRAAHGKFIIMGDADNSYDFSCLDDFMVQLHNGYDLVMGNRFRGKIYPGAMPWLHKYVGNPMLSCVGRVFFGGSISDFHCGLRGFRTSSIQKLQLSSSGMEFASEMIVKASLHHMKVTEVPINLYPDGRDRRPHLRTWRDGWRHLRLLLLYCPRWLFLYPGMFLISIGLLIGVWLLPGQRYVFDVHTLLYAAAFVIAGTNSVIFAFIAKSHALSSGFSPSMSRFDVAVKQIQPEYTITIGVVLVLMGIIGSVFAVTLWSQRHFGDLNPIAVLRLVIPSITFLLIGLQIIFGSFLLLLLQEPSVTLSSFSDTSE
jgi:glycosyltransferase involved in cell wall biosynthesis